MSDDIFDIVDEKDNVIGSLPRTEVHRSGLMHRASHVLIFGNGGCDILLQKRSATKDLYPLAYTTSCSGHVDSGEDYDTAVVREMYEETGLKVDISQLEKVGKISPCEETGNEFTFVYKMECPLDTKFSPPREEVDSLRWLPLEEFERKISDNPKDFTPSFLKVYNFWKSKCC